MNDINIKNIETLLKEKNMTQRQLADKLNVSEVTVSRWLNKDINPSSKTYKKIANALGTTTENISQRNLMRDNENMQKTISHHTNVNLAMFIIKTEELSIEEIDKFITELENKKACTIYEEQLNNTSEKLTTKHSTDLQDAEKKEVEMQLKEIEESVTQLKNKLNNIIKKNNKLKKEIKKKQRG